LRPAPEAPLPEPAPAIVAEPKVPLNEAQAARRQEIIDAYDGLKTKNHFEMLGIPRASSEAQVKEAYFRLAKRFHPDAHHDAALADLKDKLEAVFIKLGEAYEVLRNPRTRSSYESDLASRLPRNVPLVQPSPGQEPPGPDPVLETKAAEEAVRRADKLFAEEKFWDAIQLLEPAVGKLTGKPRARGQVLLARAYAKNPNWLKRAEETLQTVAHEDPKNAEAHWQLASRAGQSRCCARFWS
jgi:curved DNA-binding protein CbpA